MKPFIVDLFRNIIFVLVVFSVGDFSFVHAAARLTPETLVEGGRQEVQRKPIYRSAYYRGGYPPEYEGVCTDLVWRAFSHAKIDLKQHIDTDIRQHRKAYPRVGAKTDPNIDFRRVPNMTAFFRRHWQEIHSKPSHDLRQNTRVFQPGDIVVFCNPDHIAILSDRRNAEGIPFLLHNQGPWATEGDDFMAWYDRGFVAHFRVPALERSTAATGNR